MIKSKTWSNSDISVLRPKSKTQCHLNGIRIFPQLPNGFSSSVTINTVLYTLCAIHVISADMQSPSSTVKLLLLFVVDVCLLSSNLPPQHCFVPSGKLPPTCNSRVSSCSWDCAHRDHSMSEQQLISFKDKSERESRVTWNKWGGAEYLGGAGIHLFCLLILH